MTANDIFLAVKVFGYILNMLIFVRIILSWVAPRGNNPLVRIVFNMTEPLLAPIRNLISKSPLGGPGMMLDFSPMILVFLIEIVTELIGRLIL